MFISKCASLCTIAIRSWQSRSSKVKESCPPFAPNFELSRHGTRTAAPNIELGFNFN